MADDGRSDNKRKFDDATAATLARRPTGFSAPITSPSAADSGAPPSYNSVPPPAAVDAFEAAKLKAQEIAARLFSDAEAKRPRVENGAAEDGGAAPRGFGSDQFQKLYVQQPSHVGLGAQASLSSYGYSGTSKKIDIPNGRVGVIIGKGGETIKYLQQQSGAKIQVTRDMDADPNSPTRSVELMGTPEQISRAEQLIDDVLKEADAGGAGSVPGRRMGVGQHGGEQFIMKVPNNKVGLVIGKGGETIKSMQQKSGARIQLIPLHPPPGDTSTERTVHIDGTAEQIEAAKQLVNEVISDNRMRNPQMPGGYGQQGFRPPRPPTTWGPPGAPPMQQPGYGYMQPGAYPGAPPQYMSQPAYGSYPPQSGWDQSTNPSTQPSNPGTGYDYYNQQQQPQQQQSVQGSTGTVDNNAYNYGQPPTSYSSHGSYGGDGTYPQSSAGQQQCYGQDGYGGSYQAPPATGYSQGPTNSQSGYDQQQGYGPAPGHGTTSNTSDQTASNYGAQSGLGQATPPVQASPSQGYGQTQSSTAGYTAQGTTQPGYGMPPPPQPGYGTQPPAQPGYAQPTYAQSPQGQKPPTSQSAAQGYAQPTVQPGYSQGQAPSSQASYASSYGYGGTAPNQSGYGAQQQQQQYYDSYAGAGYSQPPAYLGDNAANGANEAASAAQPALRGVSKSPSS